MPEEYWAFDIGDPVYIIGETPTFGRILDHSHSEHGPAYLVGLRAGERRVYLEHELRLA